MCQKFIKEVLMGTRGLCNVLSFNLYKHVEVKEEVHLLDLPVMDRTTTPVSTGV